MLVHLVMPAPDSERQISPGGKTWLVWSVNDVCRKRGRMRAGSSKNESQQILSKIFHVQEAEVGMEAMWELRTCHLRTTGHQKNLLGPTRGVCCPERCNWVSTFVRATDPQDNSRWVTAVTCSFWVSALFSSLSRR